MENSNSSQMGSQSSDVEVSPPHSHTDKISLHSRDSVDYVDAQSEDLRNEKIVSLTHGSKSSTPTSETEYSSCTNSPKQERSGSEGSQGSQAEATAGSISMSANVADKLNRLRVSRESPQEESVHSSENPHWEEVRDLPTQDSDDSMGPSKRPTSKSSLRQVFPYVSCLPFENNMVFCFVLSVWDNIVGPQTVYVWKRKAFPSQKTFEVFDEPVNIEVAEDSMQAGQDILQQEMNPESPSLSKSWESQDTDYWGQSRRQSSASSNLGMLSERGSPPKLVGIHPKTSLSNKSLNQKSRSVSSIESFCEDIGNSILLESLKAVKTCEERHSPKQATQKTNYVEKDAGSEEVKERSGAARENEEREGRRGWWCGRGRLRVGAVAWYVTEHSVGVGQVGPSSDKITSVLHVVPHQGIIILAARFTVEEEEGATPYCLSMVVPVEEYDTFMPLTHTVTTWLLTTAATARLLLTKHGLVGGGCIKDKLVELCDVLVALRSASLDQYPLTPAPRPPDDRRFAEVVLTSHLQTLGASVVVADSPNAANKMIMWLAQFSDPSTLHASRLCLSYSQWPFHPGLYIQGIVRGAGGEVNLSAHKLLQSPHPITVVDVGRGVVKQTGAPDVHARRSASALSQELLSLWHDLPDVSVPSASLLEPVRGASPLVKKFLHDYDRLSSCDSEVRQGFVTAFLRSLHYTALALITWTRHQWSGERRRSGYGSLRRALCSVFDLDDRDLRVILARTELLEPGFYSYVSSMSQ